MNAHTGGDTLWASGYELYDRLSPPYQKFLESLTATHDVPALRNAAETLDVYKGERGAPDNIGLEFRKSQVCATSSPASTFELLTPLACRAHAPRNRMEDPLCRRVALPSYRWGVRNREPGASGQNPPSRLGQP